MGLQWVWLDRRAVDERFAYAPSVQTAFRRLLMRGSIGVGLFAGTECVTHAWMSTPSTLLPQHLPSFLGRHYWIYFCRTDPAYRGRGLYKLALRALLAEAARRESGGLADVYIDTAVDNIPSQRAISGVGFELREVLTTFGMPHGRLRWARFARRKKVRQDMSTHASPDPS